MPNVHAPEGWIFKRSSEAAGFTGAQLLTEYEFRGATLLVVGEDDHPPHVRHGITFEDGLALLKDGKAVPVFDGT